MKHLRLLADSDFENPYLLRLLSVTSYANAKSEPFPHRTKFAERMPNEWINRLSPTPQYSKNLSHDKLFSLCNSSL